MEQMRGPLHQHCLSPLLLSPFGPCLSAFLLVIRVYVPLSPPQPSGALAAPQTSLHLGGRRPLGSVAMDSLIVFVSSLFFA